MKIDKRRKENSELKHPPWRAIATPALKRMQEATRKNVMRMGAPLTKREHDTLIVQLTGKEL